MKQNVLFICNHNSSRSQMDEGLIRTLYGNLYEAFSTGIVPTYVNPYAVEVMKELGINLYTYWSKNIVEFQGIMFDYVVTVCDHAKEAGPLFPGKQIIHKEFNNPSVFDGIVEETLAMFRV